MSTETKYVPKYAPISEWLSVSQAARAIGLSAEQTRRLVRSGKIASLDTVYGSLVDPASLARFIEDREKSKRFADGPNTPWGLTSAVRKLDAK